MESEISVDNYYGDTGAKKHNQYNCSKFVYFPHRVCISPGDKLENDSCCLRSRFVPYSLYIQTYTGGK